jgi:hypothetical protein
MVLRVEVQCVAIHQLGMVALVDYLKICYGEKFNTFGAIRNYHLKKRTH